MVSAGSSIEYRSTHRGQVSQARRPGVEGQVPGHMAGSKADKPFPRDGQ